MATQLLDQVSTGLEDTLLTPYGPGSGLPLFIQPQAARLREDFAYVRDWFRDHESQIDDLLDEAGALVFRGFPVRDSQSFGALVEHYGSPSFGYSGGSTPRGQLAPMVYEATSTPPNVRIALHQEMAYMPTYPERLAFFCKMPSIMGGETLLGDMRRVTAELPADLIEKIDRHGVLYTRVFRQGGTTTGSTFFDSLQRTWQDAYSTDDRDEAVAQAEAGGLKAEWLDDGSMSLTYHGPGLIAHPRTGEKLWFNQLQTLNLGHHNTDNFDAYLAQFDERGVPRPFAATLGDGTALTEAEERAIAKVMDTCAIAFPWSSGDFMLIDNYRTAHGRSTFVGARDVQVALLN